jgi:hypothetical protein
MEKQKYKYNENAKNTYDMYPTKCDIKKSKRVGSEKCIQCERYIRRNCKEMIVYCDEKTGLKSNY